MRSLALAAWLATLALTACTSDDEVADTGAEADTDTDADADTDTDTDPNCPDTQTLYFTGEAVTIAGTPFATVANDGVVVVAGDDRTNTVTGSITWDLCTPDTYFISTNANTGEYDHFGYVSAFTWTMATTDTTDNDLTVSGSGNAVVRVENATTLNDTFAFNDGPQIGDGSIVRTLTVNGSTTNYPDADVTLRIANDGTDRVTTDALPVADPFPWPNGLPTTFNLDDGVSQFNGGGSISLGNVVWSPTN